MWRDGRYKVLRKTQLRKIINGYREEYVYVLIYEFNGIVHCSLTPSFPYFESSHLGCQMMFKETDSLYKEGIKTLACRILSNKDYNILSLISKGYSRKKIADSMELSKSRIDKIITQIEEKLSEQFYPEYPKISEIASMFQRIGFFKNPIQLNQGENL